MQKGAPRAAREEDSAVATELVERPKSRRRMPSFRMPPAGTSIPSYADEDVVYVVVSVVSPVFEVNKLK